METRRRERKRRRRRRLIVQLTHCVHSSWRFRSWGEEGWYNPLGHSFRALKSVTHPDRDSRCALVLFFLPRAELTQPASNVLKSTSQQQIKIFINVSKKCRAFIPRQGERLVNISRITLFTIYLEHNLYIKWLNGQSCFCTFLFFTLKMFKFKYFIAHFLSVCG